MAAGILLEIVLAFLSAVVPATAQDALNCVALVFGQSEYEMSRYYLDDADIEANQRLFGEYADEADRMLALRLPVPAYVHILKASHTFNVLDARGAISTTERAKAFARMRNLTRQAAQLWTERRA